jgi:hypothetical protein
MSNLWMENLNGNRGNHQQRGIAIREFQQAGCASRVARGQMPSETNFKQAGKQMQTGQLALGSIAAINQQQLARSEPSCSGAKHRLKPSFAETPSIRPR